MTVFVKNIGTATAERVSAEIKITPSAPVSFISRLVDGTSQLSRSLKPVPESSFTTASVYFHNDIHPNQTMGSIVNVNFGINISGFVNNENEGTVNRFNNVILPKGITTEITIFSRNNSPITLSGAINWDRMQRNSINEFELLSVTD